MKVYFRKSVMGSFIDENKTQWCCKEFAENKHKPVYDGDIYIGEEPLFIFDFEKIEFQKVTSSIMYGNGGFGDRFFGESIKKCPFCGYKFSKIDYIQQC